MQQFFVNQSLNDVDKILLDKDIIYQLKKVLRASDGYKFRLVDNNANIFLCELSSDCAFILDDLKENNELDIDITVVLSLIKNDKFDFAIQKLTELGVKKIVPYIAKRSVVKVGKGTNKIDRLKKIAKEASEQSHRNIIPTICDPITIKELPNYLSKCNLIAYEKETKAIKSLNNYKSYTIIIGPEGGFELDEVNKIIEIGFDSISLGKRILRTETAAIYLTSQIVGTNQ